MNNRLNQLESSDSTLLTALSRLDALLELAIQQAHAGTSPEEAPDFFRGLHIRPADVELMLAKNPGVPWFIQSTSGHREAVLAEAVPRLTWLRQAFGLSNFDLNVVVVALAPEIDLRYERLYAYLQDDITRKRPTVDLALNLFAATAETKLALRSRFSSDAPLVRERLIHLIPDSGQPEPPLLAEFLKLDDQIVAFLLSEDTLDRRLSQFCRVVAHQPCTRPAALDADLRRSLAAFVGAMRADAQAPRLYFQGAAVARQMCAAEAVAQAAGSRLLIVDLAQAPEGAAVFQEALHLAFRAAWLHGDVLYLEGLDGLRREERSASYRTLMNLAARDDGIVILSGTQPWVPSARGPKGVLTLEFGALDSPHALEWWRSSLAQAGIAPDATELTVLAERFRLTADQITDAVARAANDARWRATAVSPRALTPSASLPVTFDELCAAARAECGHELTRLTRKITPKYFWNDIVLPADQMAQLQEVCAQARHRETVFGRWGFDRKLSLGRGLNVLFSGPPGTGKTMAAEVIANELRLDLYKIDLSQVVSKYIGETEKNLDRVFQAAAQSNAILFFDEADALFGKRSEVKDSHDRYANIEIGYLLQKMEEYDGIAILATNVKHHIDEAFVRRIQVIVEFPFPEEAERCRVWQVIFPEEAPVSDDVDFPALGRAVRLASGNLKSIARASAFYAASEGGVIHMSHVLRASRREYQKLGRSWAESEWSDGVAPTSPKVFA